MSTVARIVPTSPDRVFAVLADGWTYPLWVVGASHMRAVDPGWPGVGTRLHHSVGIWPLLVSDTTEVVALDPGRRLVLNARGWPAGTVQVTITLAPHRDGTSVAMAEHVSGGPARVVPRPVQGLLLGPRNRESLARLAAVAVNRKG